jgi:hypothetical protein
LAKVGLQHEECDDSNVITFLYGGGFFFFVVAYGLVHYN